MTGKGLDCRLRRGAGERGSEGDYGSPLCVDRGDDR
jgi:hypothetical protein